MAREAPLRAFPEVLNPVIQEGQDKYIAQVVGGRNLPEYMGRLAGGWGTEWISRFNRLLRAPFEMEPFQTVFGGVQRGLKSAFGKQITFAVEERGGMAMLGSLSAKYGIALGLISLGYSTLDWNVRNAESLDNTMFAEGITPALATLAVEANLTASRVAEMIGAHKYREMQEEMAPGSTSFKKLLAFPLIGAFGAATLGYGAKVGLMARNQYRGMGVAAAREAAEESFRTFGGSGRLAKFGQWLTREEGLYSAQTRLGGLLRSIATPTKEGELAFKFLGKLGPMKLLSLAGAGAGLALVAPFIPGALVPSTRPAELEELYSGRKEIPVRHGRWWEMSRSAYEGGRIDYYKKHWYPSLLARSRETAIWGEGDKRSPLERWYAKEFTYELEEKFKDTRPYPVSSLPFEDVPLVGPILANTIGRIIKPPKYYHTEEWISDKGVLAPSIRYGERIQPGQQIGGIPESPFSLKNTLTEQTYRMTEAMGLPGFTMASIKESLTGSPDLFYQEQQLESARRLAGFERQYWDLELGGLIGASESFRRLYPHRRRNVSLYNPIRNQMPGWLPGPGDRSEDFTVGDPYTKVPRGESRLPGPGYAALYPELKGVAPEDYPLIHRWKILADIAPYSESYGRHLSTIRAARKSQQWTGYEEEIYQQTLEQIKEKKSSRVEFRDYKYLTPTGNIFGEPTHYAGAESSKALAALNRIYAEQREGEKGGVFQRLFGGYWELLSHNAETAMDSMTPISPAAKLIHTRTPIESYEQLQVYGSEASFWQHPIRDFLKPALQLFGKSVGFDSIPEDVERKREIEDYFDKIKYAKFSRLANMARLSGDTEALKEFEAKKDETLFGLNPFTRNYTSIFRSLPKRDRDYFNAFSAASSTQERERILEIIPENERALYVSRWKMAFVDEVKQAQKAGRLSEEELADADELITQFYDEARTEGLPMSKELYQEYLNTRFPGETYADWYRRTKLLPKAAPLPGPDWIGWDPKIDLEDVKLKLIQNLGEDMHQYNLWPSRASTLPYKSELTAEAIAPLLNPDQLSPDEARARINEIFAGDGIMANVFVRPSSGPTDEIEINLQQRKDD